MAPPARRDAWLASVHLPQLRRAEQIMAMPASARKWTVEEVREMQDEDRAWPRYELIGGELIVTPSPTVTHQRVIMGVIRLLDGYLAEQRIGELLTSPADLELMPGTIVQPDVFVLADSRYKSWREAKSLLLAVEVISPSSRRVDRVTKRRFFAEVDVAEYWVIDADDRLFERTRAGDARPEILDQTMEWRPTGTSEPLVIDIAEFFATVHRDER